MSSLIIVTSSGDWGDEFDLEGFAIYEKDRWEELKTSLPEDESFEYYYGSNEFATFESRDEYLSYLEEKPITEKEIDILCKLLNIDIKYKEPYFVKHGYTYGLFVGPS